MPRRRGPSLGTSRAAPKRSVNVSSPRPSLSPWPCFWVRPLATTGPQFSLTLGAPSHYSKAALAAAIRNVPDFPEPGIQFKDITPLLADASLFRQSVDLLIGDHPPGSIDAVVGIDARGFIFAAAAALQLNAGFVPVRKKGKLPFKTHEQSYELEYGANTVAIHVDSIKPGSRVLLIDDLLATGGTAAAAVTLLKKMDVQLVEITFLIELEALKGRSKLPGQKVRSLLTY